MSYSGRSLRRFEDPGLVTGMGSFVDDISLPGGIISLIRMTIVEL